MATPGSGVDTNDSLAEFGANDWLIEEMREQYLADPESVDASWVEYFRSHQGASADGTQPAAAPSAARCRGWRR